MPPQGSVLDHVSLPDAATSRKRAAKTQRSRAPERIPLEDRSGKIIGNELTAHQVDLLIDRHLVEVRGRRMVLAVRPRPGVSIAAINAVLRLGARCSLPVAEDSRTVRRVVVLGGQYYEPHQSRCAAWSPAAREVR